MSASDLKACPQCNEAVGGWRTQCDCGHKFGGPSTSNDQELDDLIRSLESAPNAQYQRSQERGNAFGYSEPSRLAENSVAQKPHSAESQSTTAIWARGGAVAVATAVGITIFHRATSEEDKNLVLQAQSLTNAAEANYEQALTNREECALVVRAWSEHQQIEDQANSIIMRQDVYSRGKGVKDAWSTAANKIDDLKDRLQSVVARCKR